MVIQRADSPKRPSGRFGPTLLGHLSYAEIVEANTSTADRTEYLALWEWVSTGLLLIAIGVLLILEISGGINVASRINVSAAHPSPKWLAILCASFATFLGPLGAFLGWRRGRSKGRAIPLCLQSAAGGVVAALPLVVIFFALFWA